MISISSRRASGKRQEARKLGDLVKAERFERKAEATEEMKPRAR
jgi:hypothetical protein